MIDGQTNIFEMLYPTYKITKKIRTIELFGGYGSQLLSLKYINANVEQWKLCEWAIKSIQAYKDIHFEEDTKDYSKDLETRQIKEFLFNKGISSNYNEPMSMAQINRLNDKQVRTIYNNIQATHNLVNIQQVKGKDLEIVDTDKYDYILTYSFPCQDISGAGLRKGFEDTSTRSGMLWEVERILTECKELGTLPSVLLMENVPLVHGTENLQSWNKWQLRLEELGYKNYWQDLIATDYGIPQTRNRTFMISILGDYNYTFPKPIPLKLKLKDMLEDNVDEKYYLSDKMINYLTNSTSSGGIDRGESFNRIQDKIENDGIAATITTNAGNRATDNFIKIKNATKQGYLEAYEGDGVDISSRMEYHRGTVQREKTQTLSTMGGENNGVVVKDEMLKTTLCNKLIQENKVKEYDIIKHSFSNRILDGKKKEAERTDGLISTITTRADELGVVVKDDTPRVLGGIGEKKSNDGTQWYQQDRIYDDNVSIAVTTSANPYYKNDLRIRKLTPRECGRLMCVKDEDITKMLKNQSDIGAYHCFGDSICVNVLMALFSQLLGIDWKEKLWIIEK